MTLSILKAEESSNEESKSRELKAGELRDLLAIIGLNQEADSEQIYRESA